MFTIPDRAITYPMQSRWFESDIAILAAAAGGNTGVILDACEGTESAIPAGTTEVAAGQVVVNGSLVDVAQQTVGHDIADALLPRFDLVVAYDDGVAAALAGTSDAAAVPPLPDTDSVGLYQVFVPAGDTGIEQLQIVDKRVWVPSPLAASPWIAVSVTTDLSRTSNTALGADPILQVPVSAGGTYRIKINAWFSGGSNGSGGMKYGFTGPAATRMTGYQGVMYPGSGVLQHGNYLASQLNAGQSGTATSFALTNGEALVQAEFIYVASTSGIFAFTWGQVSTNTTALIRRKGSLLEYEIV